MPVRRKGEPGCLVAMLAEQNTRKIGLYSEKASAIMCCICCSPHKGEKGWGFSQTFLKGIFLCEMPAAAPLAPEPRSSRRISWMLLAAGH